ncbi:hypothetical protein PVAP13_5NG620700 [Panicum virgatum]|uniref:Fungal lipase-type domain-containing protein n=1 Tax=Panicum virgatum TaxID=38727 RepID=A0A8T0SCK3_PANVG|nr:hypothetical protein PVAP13_5NG620700 [Panicum virgatum]
MERRGLLKAALFLCLLAVCSGRELTIKHNPSTAIYNSTLAKILVEYAAAIYTADLTQLFNWTCARCGDLIKGFKMIQIVVDVENCLEAYVGFASDINAIVVVFRGTQENSIQNWIEDLLWKQLDLDYPGMPEAMVHRGFYSAYHNTTLRDGIVSGIKKTRKFYGDIPIMITGHSMGGAMASFCAFDLVVNYGLDGVKLMTFGQPRIGNAAFASYFKTYHHFPREVWIHNIGLGSLVYSVEKICDDSGEDPTCSRSVSGTSVHDHIYYLGVSMHAEDWSSCRIVMDYSKLQYQMDLNGNVILSKQPGLSNDRGFSAQ